jgi:hypothetical protein
MIRKYLGEVESLVNAVAQRYELGPLDLNVMKIEDDNYGSPRYHLQQQIQIARKLGFESIYVLIDRIDETLWTNQSAESSFKLIAPIVTDLQTLETPGLAFKFFLWDKIRENYVDAGARPDRVKMFELRWNVHELERMLTRRIQSFSGGRVSSFNDMCEEGGGLNVHRLLAHIGAGLPRDVIRACGRIIDEHTRTSAEKRLVNHETVIRGIRSFCEERAEELYGAYVEPIRRVRRFNFTINQVASDVFRISSQADLRQWSGEIGRF